MKIPWQEPAGKAARAARRTKDEAHPGRRLTDELVREIRDRYAAGGVMQKALAEDYGIVKSTVGMIVRGETWKHLLSA